MRIWYKEKKIIKYILSTLSNIKGHFCFSYANMRLYVPTPSGMKLLCSVAKIRDA